MGLAGPVHDDRSWTFDLDEGGEDPVLGIHFLREAYERRFPRYDKGVTVPGDGRRADRRSSSPATSR